MVDRAYFAAREMGIVSRPLDMEIDGVMRRGFILTPHDALCVRTKVGCLHVGPYRVPGSSWRTEMLFKDGKPTGKKSVVFKGFLGRSGHEKGQEVAQYSGHEKGQYSGQEEGQQNCRAAGSVVGSVVKTPEIFEPVVNNGNVEGTPPSISESKSGTYPVFPSVRRDPKDLTDLPNPKPKPRAGGEDDHQLSSFGNDRPTNPADMGSKVRTIAEYLKGVTDKGLIYCLTDGQLDSQEPASKNPQFVLVDGKPIPFGRDAELKYDHWPQLIAACRSAIELRATHEMKDRETLSKVMRDAMRLLKAKHGVNIPKPWLRIIDDLKEGGKLATLPINAEQEPTVEERPTRLVDPNSTGTGIPNLFRGFGLDEFVDELVPFGYDRFKGFSDGWKFLHELLEKRGDKPAAMVRARDEFWERDATPKPIKPRWEE